MPETCRKPPHSALPASRAPHSRASSVQADDKGVWVGAPTGGYRVYDVKVYNKETGVYEALDLNAQYNLAGYNYTLRDLGDGFAMFDGAINVLDYVMEDYMVLANYVKSFPVNENGLHEIPADDARYASVYGEGRIRAYVPAPEVVTLASGWSGYTTWTLTSDGTITFSATEERYNGKCNMANYHKINGVLTLPWTPYAEQITKVVVEDGINAIGQMAFYGLPNLTEVVLADSVEDIRNYAFKNCTSLTTINIGNVLVLREGAFYGCSSLTDVDYSGAIVVAEWVFSRTGVTYP